MKKQYGVECYKKQKNGKYGFDKVELPFYGDVDLANGTQFKIGMFKVNNGKLFVGVIGVLNTGVCTFSEKTTPAYVRGMLDLFSDTDAKSICDFILGQFEIHEQYQDEIDEGFL